MINKRKVDRLVEFEKEQHKADDESILRAMNILSTMGQLDPIWITPGGQGEPDVVLGGKNRLEAMRRLQWTGCEVKVIEFFENDSGLWQAIVEGVTQSKKFVSKEAGMMEYSLAANTRFAKYLEDQLLEDMERLEIDTALYAVDLLNPTELSDLEREIDKQIKDDPGERSDEEAQLEEEQSKKFKMTVYTNTEDEQRALYDKLKSMGFECKI